MKPPVAGPQPRKHFVQGQLHRTVQPGSALSGTSQKSKKPRTTGKTAIVKHPSSIQAWFCSVAKFSWDPSCLVIYCKESIYEKSICLQPSAFLSHDSLVEAITSEQAIDGLQTYNQQSANTYRTMHKRYTP